MLSIIYANRNRDIGRIKISLDSLHRQSESDFEVVFVDYGSEIEFINDLKILLSTYPTLSFYALPVAQLLWNKSKALNYGINKAKKPFIFIADVDLVFHPNTIDLLHQIKNKKKFQLFRLGYLKEKETKKLSQPDEFEQLQPRRVGAVNGMILTSKASLLEVNGLDEFFHFYGSEDEDLFSRLETAGYEKEVRKELYFYHNWHQSFSGSEDKLLTGNPRIKNIMRINQRHFLNNRVNAVVRPLRQEGMGEIISLERSRLLAIPTKTFEIYNILAHVEHCLREEIPSYKGEVVRVDFREDPYFTSWKYKIKKLFGKQTQPYCSMKEVNDMVLKEVLFRYRNGNYSYKIAENLRTITLCIEVL